MKMDSNWMKNLVGHRVNLELHKPGEDSENRYGVLREVDMDKIVLEVYSLLGDKWTHYINMHACTLLSVTDQGKAK